MRVLLRENNSLVIIEAVHIWYDENAEEINIENSNEDSYKIKISLLGYNYKIKENAKNSLMDLSNEEARYDYGEDNEDD